MTPLRKIAALGSLLLFAGMAQPLNALMHETNATSRTSLYPDEKNTKTEQAIAPGDSVLQKRPLRFQATGNPIIRNGYTADPAPMVAGDTLWLFTSHDSPTPGQHLKDWRLFSTTDMTNWTEHPTPIRLSDFKWDKSGRAYAAQAIERDGKYYLYISTDGSGIGVAVASRPQGPYQDALGKPLLTAADCKGTSHYWACIDPTVFIDDDGQAWLFWGNGKCYAVRLKRNMIETEGEIIPIDFEGFEFEEAPWIHKYNGKYYLTYASHMPERIDYAMADRIEGPYEYKGILCNETGSSTSIHPGIAEFKGQWYFFYHNGAIGGNDTRSVCVEPFSYNADGSIDKIRQTAQGIFRKDAPSQTGMQTEGNAANPLIFADLPDVSMIRVDSTYYLSCTTNHMMPGVPVLKSDNLTDWRIVRYCYDRLDETAALNLEEGKNDYGNGTWASSLRYHNGRYYVATFSHTTHKTYIFSTDNMETGEWTTHEFAPAYHDLSLFFDEDNGRAYLIWGSGKLYIAELKEDLSGLKEGTERVLIENASAPSGEGGLPAEGSQLFKVNGMYYLFNITWPPQSMRTVVVHRAPSLNGPWEGRVLLQDRGIAQGGLVDTPDGRWFAYLFRDYSSVGRIPYLAPVAWVDGWPVIGTDGKVPDILNLPASRGLIGGIVASDDFSREKGEADLPLVWQWNHQPDNALWSVKERKGYLRLKTGRVENDFLEARNTLTQRTIGPTCAGTMAMEISHMQEGDFAGLALLQQRYGQVGVRITEGKKEVVMVSAETGTPQVVETLPYEQNKIYLKIECDFTNLKDVGTFYYSPDGKQWTQIGSPLKMTYTIPQFIGYRFALFNYATLHSGGYIDIDYFRIEK